MNNETLNAETLEKYLHDLGIDIMELGDEALEVMHSSAGREGEDFATGYVMGFSAVLSTIAFDAETFDIPLEKLGLAGLDLDRYLDVPGSTSNNLSTQGPRTWLSKWLRGRVGIP